MEFKDGVTYIKFVEHNVNYLNFIKEEKEREKVKEYCDNLVLLYFDAINEKKEKNANLYFKKLQEAVKNNNLESFTIKGSEETFDRFIESEQALRNVGDPLKIVPDLYTPLMAGNKQIDRNLFESLANKGQSILLEQTNVLSRLNAAVKITHSFLKDAIEIAGRSPLDIAKFNSYVKAADTFDKCQSKINDGIAIRNLVEDKLVSEMINKDFAKKKEDLFNNISLAVRLRGLDDNQNINKGYSRS